jgi:carboxylesterase type B
MSNKRPDGPNRNFTISIYNTPSPAESEDCLYLNVYAPTSPVEGRGRPVMFWLYGGSLQFGHAGQSAYDGSSFASYQDVVVITTNYRTNGMYEVVLGVQWLILSSFWVSGWH